MASREYMRRWYHERGGKEWLRKWKEANREKLIEQRKARYAKNAEKRRASWRTWREQNLAKARAAWQNWNRKNKELRAKKRKAIYDANPEKFRALSRAYYKKVKDDPKYKLKNKLGAAKWSKLHPETKREATQRRRARLRKADLGDGKVIRQFMKDTSKQRNLRCYYCQKPIERGKHRFDHIVALARGGSHSIDNLCVSCEPCNTAKSYKSIGQWNSLIPVLSL